MITSSPVVWNRWIAAELRRLRRESGRSQSDVADYLGCRVPKISLMESGQRHIKRSDLDKLMELYEVPEKDRQDFITGAAQARRKGWWEVYEEGLVPQSIKRLIGLEEGADRISTYQSVTFPGLLHSPDYASASLLGSGVVASEESADMISSIRQRRQRVLRRSESPVHLDAVVDESVIHRRVGTSATMRAQFEYVIDFMEEHSNVKLRILPFTEGVGVIAALGPFSILSFPWHDDHGLVFIEHPAHSIYLESMAEIETYFSVFYRLRGAALSPDDSLKMLKQAASAAT